MPRSKMMMFGVWEDKCYVGAVTVGVQATPTAGADLRALLNLTSLQMAELTRVALRAHDAPVSQIVMQAVELVKRHNPGLRLLVSYADPAQTHHGGIYQAMNWTYVGCTAPEIVYREPGGRTTHARTLNLRHGTRRRAAVERMGYRAVHVPGKHRYLYPLDKAMRRKIQKLAQPYPRRQSVDGDTSSIQAEEAGSTPADGSKLVILADAR